MITNFTSPVSQDFLWLAEYMDGNHLSEFDVVTKEENSFYAIERNKLVRFGLFGHGMNLFFEVYGGIFKLAGQMVEVIYKADGKEYYLTGQQQMYQDIITYKHAEATINLLNAGGVSNNVITQFNFGYKTSLNIDGVNFSFKAICMIPYGNPVHMNFRLVADQNLDGVIQIKKNGRVIEEIIAPLAVGVGGEINWMVT